jgi:hypothetical protein
MIDVHPDDPKSYTSARERFVRIPGKHQSKDAAQSALKDMLATRH